MNRVYKNINIFLPQKSIFLRKFQKIENIWQEFLKFFEYLFQNFNFNESYKSREIFGEFYYLVEKFIVRRQEFFREGTTRSLKGYQATPAGGPGGEGTPDGSEVSFFQTMQSIRK